MLLTAARDMMGGEHNADLQFPRNIPSSWLAYPSDIRTQQKMLQYIPSLAYIRWVFRVGHTGKIKAYSTTN